MIPEHWSEGEIAVLGLGKSGMAAARWLSAHDLRVYASDVEDTPALRERAEDLRSDSVSIDLGGHDLERIKSAVAVIVSPGVAPHVPPLEAARSHRVAVIAELDLAVQVMADSKFVAVTGTNGKTTTTALLGHLLRDAGWNAETAGNIGRPLTELADMDPAPDWVVVEVSSFQLHDAPHLSPAVGVFTNLSPDHLDRYRGVDEYYADKKRFFSNAHEKSVWVLNGDDPAVLKLAGDCPGRRLTWSLRETADAWYQREEEILRLGEKELMPRSDLRLLGEHNVENALAAALAASALGVERNSIARGIASFVPLPHRLEPVREHQGVLWINDSKATNVASARVGIRAMDRPFVWIAGGKPKGESYGTLGSELGEHCKSVIAFGEAGDLIKRDLQGSTGVRIVGDLAEAVKGAASMTSPGDAVLLSPACSSFDQFDDYLDRGETFRRLVESLP